MHGKLFMIKKIIPAVIILAAAAGIWLLYGKTDSNYYEKEFFAMDTVMTLKAWGKNAKPAVEAAEAEVERLERLLSVTREDSEIYALNKNGVGLVSEDTAALVSEAKALYERTGGAEDISVYPILRLWGFTTSSYRVPSTEEIKETLKTVGLDHIKISGHQVTLEPGTQIDLGSIAKGYASDKIVEIFKQYQLDSAIISLGGNVMTYGRKDGTDDWRVGIEDPENQDEYVGVLTVSQKAVTTAGSYQRYFEENGKRYSHIFDPSTGYPADSGLKSVTIVSDSGILSDGIDTPLFVMGLDKAADFWRKSNDFEAVFIDNNGKIYITEGLKNAFSDCTAGYTVIKR